MAKPLLMVGERFETSGKVKWPAPWLFLCAEVGPNRVCAQMTAYAVRFCFPFDKNHGAVVAASVAGLSADGASREERRGL